MVVSVLGDHCMCINRIFLFNILEVCFVIEDFYNAGNENAQLLNMSVI